MGFYIKYEDIRQLMYSSQAEFNGWHEQLSNICSSLEGIEKFDAFQGKTAESIKAYIRDIHYSLLSAIIEATSNFQARTLLYSNGYYIQIDSDKDTVLSEETLDDALNMYREMRSHLEFESNQLGTQLGRISDIFSTASPRPYSIMDNHRFLDTRVAKLKDDIIAYEQRVLNSDLAELEDLLNALKATIKEYRAKSELGIRTYAAGDYAASSNFAALVEQVWKSMNFREQHADAINAAFENEMMVQEEIKAELAELRKKEAVIQGLISGLTVAGGVLAIVATAGAATPIVAVAWVSGAGTFAYGVANFFEAGHSFKLGLDGDPFTSAFNPIRDTLFCGNQMAYDMFGEISMTVSALVVPAGIGYKGAKAADSSILQGIGVQYSKVAISAGTAYGVNKIGEHHGWSDAARFWVALGAGVFAGIVAHQIDKAYNLSGFYPQVKPTSHRIPDEGAGKLEVIDGKVAGKIPVEDYNAIRDRSVKNPDSKTLTLGKYADDATSYTQRAGETSYFDLGDDWNLIKEKYNLTDAEMFEYFNKPVLYDAISSGKTIGFSHNPLEYRVGALAQEWEFIKSLLSKTDADLVFKGGFWYVK